MVLFNTLPTKTIRRTLTHGSGWEPVVGFGKEKRDVQDKNDLLSAEYFLPHVVLQTPRAFLCLGKQV